MNYKLKENPALDIVLATLFFSSSGVWTKFSGQDAFVLGFIRAFIPVAFLFLLHTRGIGRETKIKKANKWLILASCLNALRSLLFFQALILTDISKAVIMLYLWPVFVLGLNLILKKEKPTLIKMVLILIAFTGIIIIYLNNFLSTNLEKNDLYGMSVMMVSSFVYSLTIIIFKGQGKDRSHYEITFYQNLTAVPIFFMATIIKLFWVPGAIDVLSWPGIGFACLNGLLVGVFGFLLYFRGMNRMDAGKASQLAYMEVIFAVLYGILIFHETPGPGFFIGGFLIVASAISRTFVKD